MAAKLMFACRLCQKKRPLFKALCRDCERLFAVVKKNIGLLGLGQMMDELIATGIDKKQILNFLKQDPVGKGSFMDQITAELTNNLASGMGVRKEILTAADVKRIREQPLHGASAKPPKE